MLYLSIWYDVPSWRVVSALSNLRTHPLYIVNQKTGHVNQYYFPSRSTINNLIISIKH